ncbi:uncharacterized protein LOC129582952 [Paramacrobiotus metropolitanus]|uniref:uncharacterized protein LOC129582952 n=1 Tax=Paramacrobiotus metropolitanus TaxID=2943436 RepID=UPI002445B8ED|nr:uncharacterized protein LOC129582952 [Paramacrobiotus metropolitanus]
MWARVIAMTFMVAAVSAAADLRLLGVQTRSCPVSGCPAGSETANSNSVDIKYGVKNVPQIGSTFTATYNEDGSATISVSSVNWPAGTITRLVVGNGGAGCETVGTSLTVTFDKCGIQQYFGLDKVQRRVVVKLCQRFPATSSNGVTVYFPGNRDVTVDFHLAPRNPTNIHPIEPEVLWKSERLAQCTVLTHNITAFRTVKGSESWFFSVEAGNYDPAQLGVGFSLETCILRPYLAGESAPTRTEEYWLTIIKNGRVHSDFLPNPVSPHYKVNVVQGQKYEVATKRVYSNALEETKLAAVAPEIECHVCLCDPLSSCPDTLPIVSASPLRRVNNAEEAWVPRFRVLPPLENGQRSEKLRAGPVNVVPARRKQMQL